MSRKDVNKVLSTTLDSPQLRRAFAQVSQENANRPVRPCSCVVVEIPDAARPKTLPPLRRVPSLPLSHGRASRSCVN